VQAHGLTNRASGPGEVTFSGNGQRLRFTAGRRWVQADDAAVWLHQPALAPAGTGDWRVAAADAKSVLAPLFLPTNGHPPTLRVMIDAGHGGTDSGAVTPNGRLEEKALTLDLACRLGPRLLAEGLTVGYTREEDVPLTLDERSRTAAVWRADAFVSLHANYAASRTAAGCETYVLAIPGQAATASENHVSTNRYAGNTSDTLNTLLGYCIHRRLPGKSREGDRGLRRARYQVLRDAPCPAVLVECGFLSNRGDAARLDADWFRERLAETIAAGILDFARRRPAAAAPATPAGGEEEEEACDAPRTNDLHAATSAAASPTNAATGPATEPAAR
jgi:N-acetylmuramoyl-L-alanine amidase